jgi:hypothetical protein
MKKLFEIKRAANGRARFYLLGIKVASWRGQHCELYEQLRELKALASAGLHQSHNELSLLCDLHGSDKGSLHGGSCYYHWPAHTYTAVYQWLFTPLRERALAVFECGLGTTSPVHRHNMGVNGQPGASLWVWRDWFPRAEIYGADIDRSILFDEHRIHTDYIDQTSPEAVATFFARHPGPFDIMIDDGLHAFESATCLFANAFSYLADGGIYVIEDMTLSDIPRFKRWFATRENAGQFTVSYMLMPITKADPEEANNLIIIRKAPRSFILPNGKDGRCI